MGRANRYDTHRLDAVEVTPSGALRVPARLARAGVLHYSDAEGNSWGELVPPETLFDEASMATARGIALTDLHPTAKVTPDNRRGIAVGHVGDAIARDGEYLAAPVYVTDAAAIAAVQGGTRRDVSCGYTCDLDETPGTHTDGTPYVRVQRGRSYNHVGLGPEGWGRAGTDVSLRLDGAAEIAGRFDAPVARLDSQTAQTTGARVAPKGNDVKKKIKIGGVVYRLDADEAADKTEAVDEMVPKKDADGDMALQAAKCAAMEALIAQLSKECAELKASLGAAETAPVAEADVPEAIADSIVTKRLARLDSAREGARLVAPAVKLDGLLKPRDIHAAAIVAAMPTMKLDSLSDDGVAGVFAGLVEGAKTRAAKRTDGDKKLAEVLAPTPEQAAEVARQDAAAESDDPVAQQRAALKKWGSAPLGTPRGATGKAP